MTDSSQKKDAGKPRFDLLPWGDFTVVDRDDRVDTAFEALAVWWSGRPFEYSMRIPRRQLAGIAAVLSFGAAKYEPRGWEKGIPYSKIFAAAARHADAVARGEHIDAESGLTHESHFWCNALFLAVYQARKRSDLDDRPEASAATREKLDRMEALVAQLSGASPVSAAGLVRPDGKGAN